MTLSAIESLSSIRKSRSKREVHRKDSRGAKLKCLEDSIATLDHRQNKAVIETVDGVQRIRGLAGLRQDYRVGTQSCLFAYAASRLAYCRDFPPRSLKGQFRRLINNFVLSRVAKNRTGRRLSCQCLGRQEVMPEMAFTTSIAERLEQIFDFKSASYKFGGSERAFDGLAKLH